MQKRSFAISLLIFSVMQVYSQQQWDRPMALKSCSIDIKADLFTATTFMEMEFCNSNDREIEGLHRFELNPGQVITAFQLDLNGKYRDGSIEEKWKATNAYNTIVGKRIDPALLTMDYANNYSLRIYPVPAKGCRKVTITIQESLKTDKNNLRYSLPLNITEKIQHFKLTITVNGNTTPIAQAGLIAGKYFTSQRDKQILNWEAKDITLKHPVAFSFSLTTGSAFCTKTNGQETFFALRFQPSLLKEYNVKPKTVTVFWDASASQAERDLKKEVNFLRQFISYNNVAQLTVIPFNYKLLDTAVFYTENGFNSRWQKYLENIIYDGATQLGIIDLTANRSNMILLFSDGNNTYGKNKPKTGTAFLSCVHTSSMPDLTSLQQIVGSGGGKVIDLNKMSTSSAIAMINQGETWLMNITSSSGRVITEQSLPIKHEIMLFINGTMKTGLDTLYFHYGNNNQVSHIDKIAIDTKMDCPVSAIDRITMLNNSERIIRTYSWSNLIDFGLKEKIVTPNTAYIVLERIEDYVKYNITPPKELEAECEKMNYVKRDTRFERKRIEEASEFDILSNVVNIYNERIRKWDVSEGLVYLEKSEFEAINRPGNTDASVNDDLAAGNSLNGKLAGLTITNNSLEEVIVTGYGIMRKRMLTGSVAVIRSQDIFSSATSVEQVLRGRVPGLQVHSSSVVPGSSTNITIRGISSLNGNNPILFVVDGTPVSGNINDLVNVHDIESITVLKDQSSLAIYGSRAANGAIIINTKKGRNYFNYYNNKPYRLKDMQDVEYLLELKNVSVSEKMSAYERLKEEYGGEPGFYFDVAQHYFEIGLHPQAFNILMNAAEAFNGSQQVIVAMAYILESWHLYDEAIIIYEQLVKDNPFNLIFYSDLAWAYYQSANYQRAVDILYGAIKMNTGELERTHLSLKGMLLNDMNSIISLHKDKLDLSVIPAVLIRPMPVDMRLVIDCNKGDLSNISIKEPGNYTCNYYNPVTKNGGTIQQGYYWYYNSPFEYQIKKAAGGKYKISVNNYDHYPYPGKIPSVIRIRKFKNFGKPDQSIEVENVIIDNQYGEVEIGEVKW